MKGISQSLHDRSFDAETRSDARWGWLIAGWILILAFTPIASLETLSIEAILFCFAAGFANVDPMVIFRRWIGMLVTVSFLAVFVALGHPLRRETGWFPLIAGIVLKNGILLATVASLVEKVGQYRILATLSRMGLPQEIVTTIGTMARYGPVLADQNRRMKRARQSRMIHRTLPGIWLIQSGGLSTLLSGTLKRSERIHAAMLARGWQSRRAEVQSNRTGELACESAMNAEPETHVMSASDLK